MPTLPSDISLGGLPSGNSGRPIATYDTSAIGKGVAQLGQGVANLGTGIGAYAKHEETQTNELNTATANSVYLVGRVKLDEERDGLQDPDGADDIKKRYQDNVNAAAQYLPEGPLREKFLLSKAPDLTTSQVGTNTKQFNLNKDAAIADRMQKLEDLKTAGLAAKDEATKAQVIQNGQALIDSLKNNGYIDAVQAQKMGQSWAKDYSYRSVMMLPPQQRIEAVQPMKVGDREKQAFQFFVSKGWSPAQAAGIVGNLSWESGGLDTHNDSPGDGADGSTSVGLAQWNGDRAKALRQFGGEKWRDFGTQLAFVQRELETSHSGAAEALRQAGNVRDATNAFADQYERPKGAGTGGYGNLIHWNQRYNLSRSVAAKYGDMPGEAIKSSATADFLPPDVRQNIIAGAETEITQQDRQSAAAARLESVTVKGLIKDDEASIMATGQPVQEVSPDRVTKALGPDEAARFTQNRQQAQNYYDQTHDWDTLSSDQITQRLDLLRPAPGKAGFESQQAYYNTALDRAQKTVKLRNQDPAEAVSNLPQVQQAAQNADLNRPETFLPLAKARLAAQEMIGIPVDNRIPITKGEAAALWQPIQLASPADQRDVIRDTFKQLDAAFGDQADTAMQFVLQQGHADRATREMTAAILRKLSRGELPTPAEAQAVDDAQKNAASAQAVAPVLPDDMIPTGDPMHAFVPSLRPVPSQPATPAQPMPNNEQRRLLWEKPELAPQFDRLFGKGAAEQSLSKKPKNWRPDAKAPEPEMTLRPWVKSLIK